MCGCARWSRITSTCTSSKHIQLSAGLSECVWIAASLSDNTEHWLIAGLSWKIVSFLCDHGCDCGFSFRVNILLSTGHHLRLFHPCVGEHCRQVGFSRQLQPVALENSFAWLNLIYLERSTENTSTISCLLPDMFLIFSPLCTSTNDVKTKITFLILSTGNYNHKQYSVAFLILWIPRTVNGAWWCSS